MIENVRKETVVEEEDETKQSWFALIQKVKCGQLLEIAYLILDAVNFVLYKHSLCVCVLELSCICF